MIVKLHKTQFSVATDPHRFKVVCAGRRWGKSVLARMWLLKKALDKPGLYWIVSPTFQQGKDIHWLQGYKQEIDPKIVKSWNESELKVELINGSILQLKSSEDPNRLRGVKLRALVVDEIASMRNWNYIWQEALRPTLSDYQAEALFISTPAGYNHFYDLFQLGVNDRKDYKSFRFTSYDNPNIPKVEIDAAKTELGSDAFAQEYMADFRTYTGLVYKEFDPEIHIQELPDFQPVYYLRGCDRGFTNPTAVPFIAVNSDGDWYQTHELYQSGLTTPMLAKAIEMIQPTTQYEFSTMDSAAAGDIIELNNMGFDFVPVVKQSKESNVNYVRWKITKFSERLRLRKNGKPRYFCHPRNEFTIKEFLFYRWPQGKSGLNNPESPEKYSDHMMDAIADLNAMFEHFYLEETLDPYAGKVPGTFVPPSVEEDYEENDFTETWDTIEL